LRKLRVCGSFFIAQNQGGIMPYTALSDLPDAVQKMPKHAQEIYQKAFNSAWDDKGNSGQDEASCHAIAWSAVE